MMQRRDFLGNGLALAAGSALAQSNTKIARIVVPFAPGGVQDLLARAMSTELGLALGQTVIIENRPGAGGTVGTGYVAKSAPDSGTMVPVSYTHLTLPTKRIV